MTDDLRYPDRPAIPAMQLAPASGKPRLRAAVVTFISLLVFAMVWEFVGRGVNPLLGSYPSAIAMAFVQMMRSGELASALGASLQPLAAGYTLAALAGVPAGLVLGRYPVMAAAFGVYVTAGYAMPLVALAPLFMIWFGLGFTVKMVIIFVLSFFPICINTWEGVRAVPKSLIEVGTSFVAPPSAIMWRIVLPATLPYIIAGLKLAVGKAVIAMVVAEFFTSVSGLGGIILNAANKFDTAAMFVPIILIMALAVGLTALVTWIERKIAPWQTEISGRDGV